MARVHIRFPAASENRIRLAAMKNRVARGTAARFRQAIRIADSDINSAISNAVGEEKVTMSPPAGLNGSARRVRIPCDHETREINDDPERSTRQPGRPGWRWTGNAW